MITSSVTVTRQLALDLVDKALDRLTKRIAEIPNPTEAEAREILREIRNGNKNSEQWKKAKAAFDLFTSGEKLKEGLSTVEFLKEFFSIDPSGQSVTLTAADYLLLAKFGLPGLDAPDQFNVFDRVEMSSKGPVKI